MHVYVIFAFFLAAWRWGNWRNWMTYHSTLLYIIACDLLYLFVTSNYYLWRYAPGHFLKYETIIEILYAIIVLPATGLLFLSNLPKGPFRMSLYVLMWIAIYIALETLLLSSDRFIHQHGWNLLWSLGFDMVMFPMLILHHKKPLLAYCLSGVFVCYFIWQFEVPLQNSR